MESRFSETLINTIKRIVFEAGGKSDLSKQVSNNRGGVCAGLCAEFLNAAIGSDGDFDTMVEAVKQASRGVSGMQMSMEHRGDARSHPFYLRRQTALAKRDTNTGELAAEYGRLADLYGEALLYHHASLGYTAQASGLTSANILHGINNLPPSGGQMLFSISWEKESIGHAAAVAKNSKGDVIIYDPNIGVVSLPATAEHRYLPQVVEAYMAINRQMSVNKMSVEVKPFRNPKVVHAELADLEAKLLNIESRSNPERLFNPVRLTHIGRVAGSNDGTRTVREFRSQVPNLDVDEFGRAVIELVKRCEDERTDDVVRTQALWAAATRAFAEQVKVDLLTSGPQPPITVTKNDELVNNAMQSAVHDISHPPPPLPQNLIQFD